MRIYLNLFFLFFACDAYGQARGSILDAAIPAINPMDPNGDGFITSSGAAFIGPLDQNEFELPFRPFQQYETEPGADNQYGPGCELYELITDATANVYPGYYYFRDPDGTSNNGDELIIFRFRLARFSNGSTAFSILIDTDYRFGFEGAEADANAVRGNPGFEKEVALFNNTGSDAGVWVFEVDGIANPSNPTRQGFHGALTQYYQVSYALNQHPDCPSRVPVFVDMYVPFSALGISPTTQVRMAVAANEDVDSSLGGRASDIGGVNGIAIPDDDDQFITLISHYAPIRVDQDANLAPLAIDATVFIDENTPNGFVLHTVSSKDANGHPVVYSISQGNKNNAFSVDPTLGVLTINNAAAIDHEVDSSFVLLVQVSDGSLYDNAVITVNIKDLNDNPPSLSDITVDVSENSVVGAVVHTIAASDPDATSVLKYSITGGTGVGVFDLNDTGVITVADAGVLDFETATTPFTLLVEVSDGLYVDDAEITIRVTDENEVSDIAPEKGFSPNGDSINDFWLIDGIEFFPENEVKVFNRWGHLVFEVSGYDNSAHRWQGEVNGDKATFENTYYFIITVAALQRLTGYVIVKP